MSISYSGIVNYGKAVLPSVESWGSNNNILRDPPRSITTRRIDKVSETMMIDQEIQESGDRVSESILVYPRGANVMVGVSYNNQGMNASGQQAKLPYRVMKDGVFRPPVLREFNLFPLSRLPRNNTTIDPVANTADFTKKLICPGTAKDYRSVKDDTLHVEAEVPKGQPIRRPTEVGARQNIQSMLYTDAEAIKTQNVQRPVEVSARQHIQSTVHAEAETLKTQRVERPVEMYSRQGIQNLVHAQAQTGKAQRVERPVPMFARQGIQEVVHATAHTNTRVNQFQQNNRSVKYTNDSVRLMRPQQASTSNPSRKIGVRTVDSKVAYQTNARVVTSAQSNVKARVASKQVLHDVHQFRQKPELRGEVHANVSHGGQANPNATPRTQARTLPERPSRGEHHSNPSIPMLDRTWGGESVRLKPTSFFELMRKK
jgi:hypothetical protein